MDFEPIRSSPVSAPRFGHSNQKALSKPARLARCPVLLVNDTLVIVSAFLDHSLVVAAPTEERLAAFARKRSEMETSRLFVAHPTQLIFQGVNGIQLKNEEVRIVIATIHSQVESLLTLS